MPCNTFNLIKMYRRQLSQDYKDRKINVQEGNTDTAHRLNKLYVETTHSLYLPDTIEILYSALRLMVCFMPVQI